MSKLESYHFYKSFTTTTAGFIVPMVTGTLSASSSGLIIYIILRSQQKLSTTYHRIMALMSAFDIISSIFFALGTIMMPSDTMYKFAGPLLGNKVTCKIQGWLVVFGISGGTSLNACLAWYFVCSIAFKVDSITITKCIEPIMYTYVIFIALFVPSFYLAKDFLNPHPNDSFCTISPYPVSCDEEKWYDWNKCTWREGLIDDYFTSIVVAVVVVAFHFLLIVVGMSIILWTVNRNAQEINNLQQKCSNYENDRDEIVSEHNNNQNNDEHDRAKATNIEDMRNLKKTRVVIFQALMYIGAFILTWSFNFFSELFNIANYTLDACNSLIFPLQGLWNLLIFMFDKTYSIRRKNEGVTFYQAVKRILSSPFDAPEMVFSNITHVMDTIEPAVVMEQPQTSVVSDVDLSSIGSGYDGISDVRGNISSNDMSFQSIVMSTERSTGRVSLTNVRQKFKRLRENNMLDQMMEPNNDGASSSSSSSSSLPSVFDDCV